MNITYNRRQAIGIGLGSIAGLSLSALTGCDTSAQPTSVQGPISLRMFFGVRPHEIN